MILGKLRKLANSILAAIATGSGYRLLAAREAIGKEKTKPRIVAIKAILMVSEIPFQACEQKKPTSELHLIPGSADRIDQSGGNKSWVKKMYNFPKLPSIWDQSTIISSNAKNVNIEVTIIAIRSFLFTLSPPLLIYYLRFAKFY